MAEILNVNWEKRSRRFFHRLEERRVEGKFDFKIIVGSQHIRAERNVLASSSDYFDAMLSHDTRERQDGEVEMLGVDFGSVKACVDYMYGKDVSMSGDKLESLMYVAHMMNLEELCDAIEDKLSQKLSVGAFFRVRKMAVLYQCVKLQEQCRSFAEKNFESIAGKEEFKTLEISFVVSLVTSPTVQVTEERKFEIVLNWTRFTKERKNDLLELIKCLDLSKIPQDVGETYIANEPLINTNPECMLYCSLELKKQMKPNHFTAGSNASPESKILMLDYERQDLQIFDPKECKIEQSPYIRPDTWRCSIVVLYGYIYALLSDKIVKRLNYFEEGASWDRMSDTIEEHDYVPAASVLSGFIYVLGGNTKTVERYNPFVNKWEKVTNAKRALRGVTCLGSDRYIYSFGGYDMNVSHYANDVDRLELPGLQWKSLCPMNEKKANASAAEWKSCLFVAGGYADDGAFTSLERYNIETDQWNFVTRMKFGRYKCGLFAIDGSLYAVGGYGPDSVQHTIEQYDIATNEWTTIANDNSRIIRAYSKIALL